MNLYPWIADQGSVVAFGGWLNALVGAGLSLLGGSKGGGSWEMIPERSPSANEQYLANLNQNNYTGISNFWNQSIDNWKEAYSDYLKGIIPQQYQENIKAGMKSAVEDTSGAMTAKLAKSGALGSTAYDRDRYNLDKNVTSAYSQQANQVSQNLYNAAQNRAQIAGDWLKYPTAAWQTEISTRRAMPGAVYKPNEPSAFTSLAGAVGNYFGGQNNNSSNNISNIWGGSSNSGITGSGAANYNSRNPYTMTWGWN